MPDDRLTVGGEVAAALLARIAATHGLSVCDWSADGAEAGTVKSAPSILLTLRATEREMRLALGLGSRAIIEIGDDETALPVELPLRLKADGGLHLSLSTATAFSLDMTPVLCDVLLSRGWLAAPRRADAEICLQEALSNAVIHGNLSVDAGSVGDAASFERFFTLVHARLADRRHASRRIMVTARAGDGLHLSVMDQGDGHAGLVMRPVEMTAKSGRGIRIMHDLADHVRFSDGGRRVHLHFQP
ncbi:ATP-binding protein [Niveispirillum fermenti]